MPVDLKRQGRAEEHIGLFYPSTREDRVELLRVMMKKTGVDIDLSDVPDALLDGERTYSGADMEALLTRAKFRAATRALDDSEAAEPAPGGDGVAPDAKTGDGAPAEGADATNGRVTRKILEAVVDDFVPPSYPLQVELQNLVAVMECTSRSMLPERYRQLDREATVRRIGELKRLIGDR
jgi:SpoVK/Ycf46/Vps4 family AAA+-type ATPase